MFSEYEAEVEEERLRKEREARERQDVMTLGKTTLYNKNKTSLTHYLLSHVFVTHFHIPATRYVKLRPRSCMINICFV